MACPRYVPATTDPRPPPSSQRRQGVQGPAQRFQAGGIGRQRQMEVSPTTGIATNLSGCEESGEPGQGATSPGEHFGW